MRIRIGHLKNLPFIDAVVDWLYEMGGRGKGNARLDFDFDFDGGLEFGFGF